MSKPKVIELIKKLDYDAGVKKRFIDKVRNEYYETHESFLSTPLLAILMLLTFERNANIPEQLHLFYAKAFETLYEKHDATKEQHQRARKTSLQIDQFQSLFATFCLKSYVQEKMEFSTSEMTELIRESIRFQKMDVDPTDFLFDIEESVCLVMKEGGSYFFIHRSFQEYFTAIFLKSCAEDMRDKFLDRVDFRIWDSVLPMLFAMAASQVEPTWVASRLDKYLENVGPKPGQISPLEATIEGLGFHKTGERITLMRFVPGPFSSFRTRWIFFILLFQEGIS